MVPSAARFTFLNKPADQPRPFLAYRSFERTAETGCFLLVVCGLRILIIRNSSAVQIGSSGADVIHKTVRFVIPRDQPNRRDAGLYGNIYETFNGAYPVAIAYRPE
ncbi:MAG TPA: hypothetical protein DDW59_09810 [Gammaproteobacteria bacterium]|nr:hypothetical protein [Gammaproteobacteria bacterium]